MSEATSAISVPGADPGPAVRLFLYTGAAGLALFALWAAFSPLDVVSTATGQIIPSSQVQRVQHLEGGIVREILVREGDRVQREQPLVVLQATASEADMAELKVRLAALGIELARLEAEATGAAAPAVPPDLAAAYPQIASQARSLFTARRQRVQSQIAAQRETISQRQNELREIQVRLRNAPNSLRMLEEQVRISDDLLRDQLTSRLQHLSLTREANNVRSRIEEDTAAQARAQAALDEARATLNRIDTVYQEEVRTALDTARRQHEEISQRAGKLQDNVMRTTLRAPVDGLVKVVHVTTEGGVVKAGDPVIDIVPINDRLVVEARLPAGDIGFVHPGQSASVRLASFDAVRFGNLSATVINVAPDTLFTQQGQPFYRVRLETERDHFRSGDFIYTLLPGVEVTASIHIGQRTVLDYFLEPFLDNLGRSLHER